MSKQITCKECGKRFWAGYGADNGGEDLCEQCVERRENAKPKALALKVTDRDSMIVGRVAARVGLKTKAGVITRMTENTIWCVGSSGHETKHREFDGRLPAVFKSYAGKNFQPIPSPTK